MSLPRVERSETGIAEPDWRPSWRLGRSLARPGAEASSMCRGGLGLWCTSRARAVATVGDMTAQRITGLLAAFAAAAVAAAGGGAVPPPGAPAGFHRCDTTSGALCGTVVVPLDRSGATSGSVRLHVEELPPPGEPPDPAKTVFLIAGGPGQGSAQAFELRRAGAYWRFLFPGFTVVAFDNRGTGASG